jgi:hypothetical protein
VKTEILSAENQWQQIQFNEKMGKYRKSKLKNIVKYNLLSLWFSFKLVFISKINAMFTWALKPNKITKHRLIWWRNVGSLTFFVWRGRNEVLCYGKCWPNFLSETTFNKTNFWFIFSYFCNIKSVMRRLQFKII